MTHMQLRHDSPARDDGCVSAGALAERGWTEAAVRRFLGDPDRMYPMRLFRLDRVVAAEGTEQWRRWREKSVQRSARGKAVADAERACLLAEVAALDIRVPVISSESLAARSVAHRNQLDQDRMPAAVGEVDAATLRRWMVDYLRHQTTVYDATLDSRYAGAGRAEATLAIRDTIYAVIADAYPDLAGEARRQVAARTPEPQARKPGARVAGFRAFGDDLRRG
jgi:hypothetical protein